MHRMVVSHHTDLTIRFRDLSAQLLVSSDTTPLRTYFPNPLPWLTIDVLSVLADPSVATRTSPKLVEEAHIVASHLALESLECAVVLRSGEIVVFRQGPSTRERPVQQLDLDDQELISTAHIPIIDEGIFRPLFVMLAGRGSVTACCLADIGTLFVIDRLDVLLMISRQDSWQLRSTMVHYS